MKRYFLAALGFAIATSASAADLPSKTVPTFVAPKPVFTWTGAFVGLNAGYAFGDGRAQTTGTPAFLTLVGPGIVPNGLDTKPDGFIGGGQVGYNLQFGALVAGVEADLQFADLKKSSSFVGAAVLGTQLTTSAGSEITYLGTARARLGFTPFDRLLIFGTAGLAFGDVKNNGSVTGVQAPALQWTGTRSDTKFGYAVGGGLEYALTDNLTAKGEYLYYDLGKTTVTALGNPAVRGVGALDGIDYVARVENRGSILRAGVNYKF